MDRRSLAAGWVARVGLLAAMAVVGASCDAFVSPTAPPVSTPAAVVSQSPTLTPTPRPTPTPTPRPSPSPTPSPTPSPDPNASPTDGGPVGLVAACPGTAPTSHEVGETTAAESRNWSGYVANGGNGFDCVEAIWVQPTVRCSGTTTQSAVYWVGLGGYLQESLVQIGTESSCIRGEASASAWRESLPDEHVYIRLPLRVAAGQRIWAQVRWLTGSRYRLSMSNLVTRRHFSIEVTNATLDRTSADWIVEAPTSGCPSRCRNLKMPDFRTFRFRSAWVSLDGVRRPVDSAPFVHTMETMVSAAGAVRADVISTAADGTSFAVRWRRP